MMKKIIATAVLICAIFTLLAPTVYSAPAATGEVEAEILKVYDGRDSIISMTFDDGIYETAENLNTLFEKYNLYGTLMMTADSAKRSGGRDAWLEIFEGGRLEPQNHSYSHKKLYDAEDSKDNLNYETYQKEIVESGELLREYFPEYDIITYAMPYGAMTDEALLIARDNYYAVRATTSGVQSLDPDTTTNSGGWYKMHSPPVTNGSIKAIEDKDARESAQWAIIKNAIDAAVNNEGGGWYLPITHAVSDTVESADMSLAVAEKMFAYISDYDKAGKAWVTTYSAATKYVRERQNSTVYAWEEDGSIFVSLYMNATTSDGKTLSREVFDQPLTVKVEVPASYGTVHYTVNGAEYSATAYAEGAKNFVNINLTPGAERVKLRLNSSHTYGKWEQYDDETHKRVCTDCGAVDFGLHEWDGGAITLAPNCSEYGKLERTCTVCDEVGEFPIDKNGTHDFTKKTPSFNYKYETRNCQHGDLYFICCSRCGKKGTETFEIGEPTEHQYGKWKTVKQATDTEDGYNERVCKTCGEAEREIIPKKVSEDEKDSTPTPLIIGISVGAAVILATAAAATVIIIKRKKK